MQYTWFNSRSIIFTGENERVYTGSQAGCASPDGSSAKSAQKLKRMNDLLTIIIYLPMYVYIHIYTHLAFQNEVTNGVAWMVRLAKKKKQTNKSWSVRLAGGKIRHGISAKSLRCVLSFHDFDTSNHIRSYKYRAPV
jgi:hypothetical protein